MTAEGVRAALAYGATLPTFSSLAEAQSTLLSRKDRLVNELIFSRSLTPEVALDFSPESLLRLEKWYFIRIRFFTLFKFFSKSRAERFARMCSAYFGEVVTHSLPDAIWVVEEDIFVPGHYSIGVRHGFCTMVLTSFYSSLHHKDNRKHDCLWRKYQKYFARNPDVEIDF